jgi:uncharacterized protein YbjT (DUF2867 family)
MYLVTGATGNVGSQVVAQLLDSGKQVRLFVRDPGKVAHWGARWGDRVQVAIGDFSTPESFGRAVAGVEGAFLMNGGPGGEPFRQLLASAKAQGQPRMVFLSTIFASEPDIQVGQWHKEKEDAIRESGLPGAFVRPSGFMTNAFQWIATMKSEGIVYNAMGTGQYAPIAPEDIAAVVVKALTMPSLSDEVFELTGGALLSVPEQVGILADVLGKPIRCIDVPTEAAVHGLMRSGMPAHMAAAVGQSFEAVRDGRTVTLVDTVERVTGRRPKTLDTWAREHASLFA